MYGKTKYSLYGFIWGLRFFGLAKYSKYRTFKFGSKLEDIGVREYGFMFSTYLLGLTFGSVVPWKANSPTRGDLSRAAVNAYLSGALDPIKVVKYEVDDYRNVPKEDQVLLLKTAAGELPPVAEPVYLPATGCADRLVGTPAHDSSGPRSPSSVRSSRSIHIERLVNSVRVNDRQVFWKTVDRLGLEPAAVGWAEHRDEWKKLVLLDPPQIDRQQNDELYLYDTR